MHFYEYKLIDVGYTFYCSWNGLEIVNQNIEESHKEFFQWFFYNFLKADAGKYYMLNNKIGATAMAIAQPAFTCSKLTVETLEKCVKYVQS